MADAPAAEPTTTALPPTPAPPPVAPAAPAPLAAPPSVPAPAPAPAPAPDVHAELEKWKALSRKNEDNYKQTSQQLEQQQALLVQLAEKAGIEVNGKPDPEKLIQQLTSAKQAGQETARELAVFRAAAAAGANADALLDSRGFMAKTAGLDTAAADFNDRIKALVAEAAAANPTLVVQPTPAVPPQPAAPAPAPLPASSGADFSSAPPGSGQWTEQDVENASSEALSKAIDQGLLRDLGYAPRRHGRNR